MSRYERSGGLNDVEIKGLISAIADKYWKDRHSTDISTFNLYYYVKGELRDPYYTYKFNDEDLDSDLILDITNAILSDVKLKLRDKEYKEKYYERLHEE